MWLCGGGGRPALTRTLLLLSQGPALWPLVAVVTPIEDLFLNTAALEVRTLIQEVCRHWGVQHTSQRHEKQDPHPVIN